MVTAMYVTELKSLDIAIYELVKRLKFKQNVKLKPCKHTLKENIRDDRMYVVADTTHIFLAAMSSSRSDVVTQCFRPCFRPLFFF